MVRLMLISPRKLFEHSFLAGTILSLAALTLVVDLALIGLRGYAYNREFQPVTSTNRR